MSSGLIELKNFIMHLGENKDLLHKVADKRGNYMQSRSGLPAKSDIHFDVYVPISSQDDFC